MGTDLPGSLIIFNYFGEPAHLLSRQHFSLWWTAEHIISQKCFPKIHETVVDPWNLIKFTGFSYRYDMQTCGWKSMETYRNSTNPPTWRIILRIGLWGFPSKWPVYGLSMGVILTTYKSWDDPPSNVTLQVVSSLDVCSIWPCHEHLPETNMSTCRF